MPLWATRALARLPPRARASHCRQLPLHLTSSLPLHSMGKQQEARRITSPLSSTWPYHILARLRAPRIVPWPGSPCCCRVLLRLLLRAACKRTSRGRAVVGEPSTWARGPAPPDRRCLRGRPPSVAWPRDSFGTSRGQVRRKPDGALPGRSALQAAGLPAGPRPRPDEPIPTPLPVPALCTGWERKKG